MADTPPEISMLLESDPDRGVATAAPNPHN